MRYKKLLSVFPGEGEWGGVRRAVLREVPGGHLFSVLQRKQMCGSRKGDTRGETVLCDYVSFFARRLF